LSLLVFSQSWWKASLAGLSWLLFVGTLITQASVLPQSSNTPSRSLAGEEFVGPFPSWVNLKTAYHAVGDGRADDSAAFQNALNELGASGHSPVLYIPSGHYRITRTLALSYNINLSVVGEDPASTFIVWDGPAGGTMLSVNGIAYSRFTRLTFMTARQGLGGHRAVGGTTRNRTSTPATILRSLLR
jgi:hypothetical protein